MPYASAIIRRKQWRGLGRFDLGPPVLAKWVGDGSRRIGSALVQLEVTLTCWRVHIADEVFVFRRSENMDNYVGQRGRLKDRISGFVRRQEATQGFSQEPFVESLHFHFVCKRIEGDVRHCLKPGGQSRGARRSQLRACFLRVAR